VSPGHRRDPAWIRVADRCYELGLSLFSSAHRAEYGDLMRQAFRDRCREVSRGERGALRTFALELAPDLLSSIGRENMNSIFGDMRPRQVMLLALLGVSSAYFVFGEALGLRLSDVAVTVTQAANEFGREREAEALRSRFHGIAEPLAVEGTAQSKALAALMYRLTDLSTGWITPNEGNHADVAKAAALSRAMLAGPVDPYLLALSARQCWRQPRFGADPTPGADRTMDPWNCDLARVTRRMIELTPDNGYAWALEYKLGVLAHNPGRMRRALAGLAASRYVNAFEGRIVGDLLTAVERTAPQDAQTLDDVASALSSSGWSSGVRVGTFCDPTDASTRRFGLSAVEISSARDDCVRAGRLMATSTHLNTAMDGVKIVEALSDDPAERAAAQALGLELEWLANQMRARVNGHDWMFSDRPRVDMWLATFRAREGEIPSARRWLRDQGMPAFKQD